MGNTTNKTVSIQSKAEAQALAEFLYKEGCRHGDDIQRIVKDLRELEKKWKVTPRGKYVNVWVKP